MIQYINIKDLPSKDIFKYIVVTFILLIVFKKYNIQLNFIVAIGIAYIYMKYNIEYKKQQNKLLDNQHETKVKYIKPYNKNIANKSEIVDFLFFIQDMYKYNPQSYEELVDNLGNFFLLNNYIMNFDEFCDEQFQIMESKKRNAINALHSIIYSLPNNKKLTKKHTKSMLVLENLLNKYMEKAFLKCESLRIKQGGYDITRRTIPVGPLAYNNYLDREYTYDIY
jgi:hypothetical protein